jgi:pilus assembly protein CpaB
MRNLRPFGVLMIALLLGLAAAGYAAKWLQQQNEGSTQQVLVAARDLQMGTRLMPDMMTTLAWPKAASLKDPLMRMDQAVGRVIRIPVLRGEPFLMNKLAPIGDKGGLSSVLSEGQRAVTVKVNEIVGVAGFALPGNYVDVMVNTPDQMNQPVSKIVLERIQVLAVAQDVASTENKPRVVNAVTLQVTPIQAEQIDLARSIGTLSLVLRSQSDQSSVSTQGARKIDLLQGAALAQEPVKAVAAPRVASTQKTSKSTNPPQAAPSPNEAEPPRLEVIRGLQLTRESVREFNP